jgi:hypothetical protein
MDYFFPFGPVPGFNPQEALPSGARIHYAEPPEEQCTLNIGFGGQQLDSASIPIKSWRYFLLHRQKSIDIDV